MPNDLSYNLEFNVNVRVNSNRGPAAFTLALDLTRFTSQVMCTHFTKGRPYEPEVFEFLVRALRAGDTFVDVGAHVGYFSLLAASLVGHGGHVFSFEPNPRN